MRCLHWIINLLSLQSIFSHRQPPLITVSQHPLQQMYTRMGQYQLCPLLTGAIAVPGVYSQMDGERCLFFFPVSHGLAAALLLPPVTVRVTEVVRRWREQPGGQSLTSQCGSPQCVGDLVTANYMQNYRAHSEIYISAFLLWDCNSIVKYIQLRSYI